MGIALNLRQLALIEYKYGNSQEATHLKTEAIDTLETIRSPYLEETRAMTSHVQPGQPIYERHEFNQVYDMLWKKALKCFEQGHVETDPNLLNLQNDERRGLSIIVFPDRRVAQEFSFLINTLMRVDADQYYYSPDQFHVTVLSLFTARKDFAPFFAKEPKYKEVIRSVVSNQVRFPITFSGVTASPGAVMVKGFTQEPSLNQLRDQLVGALHESGLDEELYSRYQRSTAHCTVMRFKKQPKNLQALRDTLARFKNYQFGESLVETLVFVEHDWYNSPDKIKILAEYPLKPTP
jgi:2'-5' RNA ligase